ncbi:hypothetical protein I9W82_001899 [Candida metapsilosis]|uniref:Uncharacterized protein n=1 Tax=Candida metapsilosis TaxID=273372 RepID=A0A8H8DBP6_9ASCO|nr:hypothetical protein I9W82_001899 [Candida metapsilosis]
MFEIPSDSLSRRSVSTAGSPGSSEPSPSKKRWRGILRPGKSNSPKPTSQFKRNASYGNSYALSISDESKADKSPFPPMFVRDPLLTPPQLSAPSFDSMSSNKFERGYSTPDTTPKSVNFFESPNNGESYTEGLNSSFASILNNNLPHLKRRGSQAFSTKTSISMKSSLDNTCFICSELLSNVLQSERVLKLNCGDSVHFECFKTAYEKELAGYKNNEPNLELPNLCHGSICKGERSITIDNRNLSSLLKRPYTAKLTPKRPAPTQPKASPAKPQSVNFKALKSTLNHFELSRRSSLRNRDTMISSIRSPSPVNTISTTMTDSYNINGFDSGQSSESVVNQLMQYLLSNCTTLNLAKISQLGMLRVADQLQIKIEDESFNEKYCYLFENSVVIWDKISQAIFIPVKNAKITCKGPVVTITPTEGDVLHFSLQSHLSSVIEKWAIVLMDLSVEIPGCKITNTIDLVPRTQPVFGGLMSPIVDSPQISTEPNEVMVDNSDSDADSDEELIQSALKENTHINLKELQSLISEVDQML